LRNALERIVLLENGPVLEPEYLPFASMKPEESSVGKRIDRVLSQPIPDSGIDFEEIVSDLERQLILKASDQTNWNQSQTARLLNIKRDKLRYRMRNFSLAEDKDRDAS
jgi:DNA-binding NtrC family response regulator